MSSFGDLARGCVDGSAIGQVIYRALTKRNGVQREEGSRGVRENCLWELSLTALVLASGISLYY